MNYDGGNSVALQENTSNPNEVLKSKWKQSQSDSWFKKK